MVANISVVNIQVQGTSEPSAAAICRCLTLPLVGRVANEVSGVGVGAALYDAPHPVSRSSLRCDHEPTLPTRAHKGEGKGRRYSPGCLPGSECIWRTRRTPHQTSRMATGTDAAVTISGAKAWPKIEAPLAT